MTRVVSLLPSATEIAFALGLGDQVVGVTFECDYPPDPRVGRAVVVGGLDTHGLDAGAIDALVRQRVADGADLYTLDVEAFRALDPQVVLTQDLCRVCALPSGQVDQAMQQLGCHADVVTLDPHTIDDIFTTIVAVGDATGRARSGRRAGGRPASTARGDRRPGRRQGCGRECSCSSGPIRRSSPATGFPSWSRRLVANPCWRRAGERSVPTTWEEVAAVDPDIVVVSSCGFDAAGSAVHATQVLEHLPARASVWAIDANGLMVRPGPRVVDGVETLAAIFHGADPPDPSTAIRVR